MTAGETSRSPAEATQWLQRHGIRTLLATMTDQAGIMRVKVIPADRVPGAVAHGVSFSLTSALMLCSNDDIADVPGYRRALGDVRLFPDLRAMRVVDVDAGLAWAPVDQWNPDGTRFPVCQRAALADQRLRGDALGLDFRVGMELEFTVFDGAGHGSAVAHTGPGYGLAPVLALEPWITEVLDSCQSAGVEVAQLHAEYGAGQVELALQPSTPVKAIDDVTVTRVILARSALRHGLAVSFAPLALEGGAANGSHIHVSAISDGHNVFADGDTGHAMTQTGEHLVSGLVHGLPDAVAMLASSINSYARLEPGHFSGAYSCWGLENREAAIRYIPGAPGRRAQGANCEIKTADGSANLYLATAAVLALMLHGAATKPAVPISMDVPPADLSEAELAATGAVRFAASLPEALALLRRNEILRSALGDAVIDTFAAVREQEYAAYGSMTVAERIPLLRFRF